jgi:hypothetical protein
VPALPALPRLCCEPWRALLAIALLWLACLGAVRAQGVELVAFQVQKQEGTLTLDFGVKLALPKVVEDALRRGVPIYFVAEAQLIKPRWYWRDERLARVSRAWRIAWQPLTGTWRVGLGGLNQSHPNLEEALAAISRVVRWRLAELAQVDGEKGLVLEFNYRLDTSQLPGPMQIGLGAQAPWVMGIERVLRLD